MAAEQALRDSEIIPITPSGEVIATEVPYESFLTDFGGQSVEWVNGVVIKMSPVTERHDEFVGFLRILLATFLEMTGGGRVLQDPMVMRPAPDMPARAPDIQVILPDNMGIVRENEVAGPADLVVEIVSPGSHRRDRVEKFAEYEKGGVPEYWILDPLRKETLFYQRSARGIFEPVEPDEHGVYHSRALRGLKLPVEILWQRPLPGVVATVRMVEAMLRGN